MQLPLLRGLTQKLKLSFCSMNCEFNYRNHVLEFSCFTSLSNDRKSTAPEHDSCKNYYQKEDARLHYCH